MENKSFEVYREENISLSGCINNNTLHLTSMVYGEWGDSEKYYDFTKENTEKLFSLISFENFLEELRKDKLDWLSTFLKENDIQVKEFCWVEL